MKWYKYIPSNIDAILLSLVICINCIRVILGLGETTIILYALFILCAFVLILRYSKKLFHMMRKKKMIQSFVVVIALMVLYATVSMSWIPSDEIYITYLKFILSLVIGVFSVALPIEKIKEVIKWVIVVNIGYAILFIINPDLADVAMRAGLNYLNVTLPLGLALTLSLIMSLNAISNKGGLVISSFWLLVSALFFIALVGFVARGVLIFPPLIAIIMFVFMKKEHKYISWLLIPMFLGVLFMFYQYYLLNASDYAANRMMRFFEASEDEDRWELWSQAIKEIKDNYWYFLGGGIDSFRYVSRIHFYPHNIFIQVIGEYGLLGIIITIMILWNVVKGFVHSKVYAYYLRESALFYCIMGAFVYYTLTYSKSFSLYDGLPLFVVIAFCLAIFYNFRDIRVQETQIPKKS